MSITFEQIAKANESIKTTKIKNKDYAEVPQRVKAFRMVYPNGLIDTALLEDTGDRCSFRATVADEDGKILATGTAFEERKGMINGTSYIENCETSAVGRALGFAGFGIDVSIASAEEVSNAIAQQEAKKTETPKKEPKTKEPSKTSGKTFSEAPKDDGTPIEKLQIEAIQTLLTDAPAERIDAFNKALVFYDVVNITKLTKAQAAQMIARLRTYK